MKDKAFIKAHGGSVNEKLHGRYSVRITDYLKNLVNGHPVNDAITRQYIPTDDELNVQEDELEDPIGDDAHSPVEGIVHRYPDRVLLKVVHACPVYCRYCFRREMVGPKAGAPASVLQKDELNAALEYIAQNTDIYEVILTGGDPLILSPKALRAIISQLNKIDHVRVIRIHSRLPVADPERITSELCDVLACAEKALFIAVHVNHKDELAEPARKGLLNLQKSGAILISQSVLLKGVNDDAQVLESLLRELVAIGVKPYYLHHPDKAPGTSHFRVTIEKGQEIMRKLQGSLSGLCLPVYMLDIPGGHGKIPLTPCYIEKLNEDGYNLTDYKGKEHQYE